MERHRPINEPRELERALRRGLATDPAQRTSTPGELVEELRAGWDSEPLPTGVVTFLGDRCRGVDPAVARAA